MIIGITGYARHGKNTIGDILVNNYGFKQSGFADKVKESALAINPYIDNNLRLCDYVNKYGWDYAKTNNLEVRRLLQYIGTEMGRNLLGDNIWIDTLFNSINLDENNVITDVRFPDEANAIREHNGQVWKVFMPFCNSGISSSHSSENSVDKIEADIFILNSGTIKELEAKINTHIYSLLTSN
jgi:hypothetical protein